MSPNNTQTTTPPSAETVAELKRLAAGIIRAQGNRFIKELLRSKKIRIGTNKDDFEQNLDAAIETGDLTLDDVDTWLKQVEGWGNQHVYLYCISSTLRKDLSRPKIQKLVKEQGFKDVWNGRTVNRFPQKPELTSISFDYPRMQILWQEAAQGWTAVVEKNFEREEGLDTFEYRAYRRVDHRAITRFEARLDLGLAALFISKPIAGEEHRNAIAEARSVIKRLMNIALLDRNQVDISRVSRNLDQQNIPNNAQPNPEVRTQRSRLSSGGAYIEFAATSRDKAYWEEPAIQNVRDSVKSAQLTAFKGENGMFIFQPSDAPGGLRRPLRVQLFGADHRIRLWAQMDADEVWAILVKLSEYK